MRLCKHYISGVCQNADKCTYAHVFEELHPSSPDIPKNHFGPKQATVSTSLLAQDSDNTSEPPPDMRLRKKTELCSRFLRNDCSHGTLCPFAHSEQDLGQVSVSVMGKVKSRLCVFWDDATKSAPRCVYGANCINAHGEGELGLRRANLDVPDAKRRREGDD